MNSTRSLLPLLLLSLWSPVLLAGTVVVPPVQFEGTVGAGAGFDLGGDIFLGGNTAVRGEADVVVTLTSGRIQITEIQARLDAATWSGSGTFVNPTTFQSVPISLEIVTAPTTFSIATTEFFSLTTNASGELEWASPRGGFQGIVSQFQLAGTYTLRGPTETVTGQFNHSIGSREISTSGVLQAPNFPDEIELRGGLNTFFPDTFRGLDAELVNDTVDGIRITTDAFGIRSGMGIGFGSLTSGDPAVLTAVPVPEPGVGLLAVFGGLLGLRRKR